MTYLIDAIDNFADTIDSRDVIARIEHLETELDDAWSGVSDDFSAWVHEMADNDVGTLQDAAREYLALYTLQASAECYAPDWEHGAQLIRDSYFEEAMDDLVADCYETPKDLPSFMTITLDYDLLRTDYTEVDFGGVTYLIR